MSTVDLDAIRARHKRAVLSVSHERPNEYDPDHCNRAAYILTVSDVPTLLAEVDALRTQLAEAHVEVDLARTRAEDARAEVERLRQDYEDAHADRLARTLERDRTIDEREYLKAEVERLRQLYADHRAVIEAQAAEITRLRATGEDGTRDG